MQQSLPLHLFSIPPPRAISNRLLNKKLPAVTVNDKTNTIECKQSDGDPTVQITLFQLTRSEHPLPLDTCLTYFQVEVLSLPAGEESVNIGLTARDNNMRQFAGKMINSVGFLKGEVYLSKRKISSFDPPSHKLKAGHRIGCGINPHSSTIFFTHNGVILQEGIPIPTGWTDFYPAVGLNNEGETVRCWFGAGGDQQWMWKCQPFIDSIRKQVTEQIYKNKSQPGYMYSLVHEYLQFHGYSQTLALSTQYTNIVKSKQIDYPVLPYPTRNSSVIPSICLEESPPPELPRVQFHDDQFQPPLKLRSRVMSDMGIDEEKRVIELPRKNTMMGNQGTLEVEGKVNRKESLISNISLFDESEYMMSNGFDQVKQSKIKEEDALVLQTATDKFLFESRPAILQHISNQRIEQALELLHSTLPKLFQLEQLLQIHMKSHIFLRKARQGTIQLTLEGQLQAILYAKQEKGFITYKNHLFPIVNYEKQELEWQPLKAVLKILTSNPAKSQKELQEEQLLHGMQFKCFATHVNSLILKHMGYMQDSRLGILLQHTKRAQQKIKDFKGMTCGIEIHM